MMFKQQQKRYLNVRDTMMTQTDTMIPATLNVLKYNAEKSVLSIKSLCVYTVSYFFPVGQILRQIKTVYYDLRCCKL